MGLNITAIVTLRNTSELASDYSLSPEDTRAAEQKGNHALISIEISESRSEWKDQTHGIVTYYQLFFNQFGAISFQKIREHEKAGTYRGLLILRTKVIFFSYRHFCTINLKCSYFLNAILTILRK